MRRLITLALVFAAVCGGATGCRTDAAKTKVFITRDGKVVLQPAPDKKGETIFRIENNNPAERRMTLLELDPGQDPAALPVDGRGVVPTGKPADLEHRGDGYRVISRLDTMRPYYGGDQRPTTTLHTYLRKGNYVFLSNLPGDYRKGFWTAFTIGAGS